MALTIGSHPSSRRGFGPGVAVGTIVSTGPFTALRVVAGTSGMRSLSSVRFIVREDWPAEGAAVVAETWRPMRKQQATASPDKAKPRGTQAEDASHLLRRDNEPTI